ncbi:MAG: hypothetical protein JW699_05050, partial [Chitinispirillaceae bacterium]|nr:hypothetical protein [Chitinispirillaceae bacterium]
MINPKLLTIRQKFTGTSIKNIEDAVTREIARAGLRWDPGMRIAIAAGSRGIANIGRIVGAVVRFLRESGTRPFIVPAMGSHGGATAEG